MEISRFSNLIQPNYSEVRIASDDIRIVASKPRKKLSKFVSTEGDALFIRCSNDLTRVRFDVHYFDSFTTPEDPLFDFIGSAQISISSSSLVAYAWTPDNVVEWSAPFQGGVVIDIYCSGRDRASAGIKKITLSAAEDEIDVDEMRDRINQFEGIEKYKLYIYPRV